MSKASPTLSETLEHSWACLIRMANRAAQDRPYVAFGTCDINNAPQIRTVALRSAHPQRSELEVYADTLSHKIKEIRANSQVSVLAWFPSDLVQLRLSGQARIQSEPETRAYWNAQPPGGLLNYSHHPSPGAPIDSSDGYTQSPNPERFALITVTVDHIDHVCLAESGHRRAEFLRSDNWGGQWLSP